MKPIFKKLLVIFLALTLIAGLVPLPAAAAETSSFSDITDPQVGEAAEILRVMGIVQGMGNNRFEPDLFLTRAEFCTMAIKLMGKESEAEGQKTRTIFADVASTHWARGFINLAAITEVGGSRLMLGTGDGKFSPDDTMTWAGAVTFALRLLGYGTEANANWPQGAVALAPALELDKGVGGVAAGAPLTRAQAALFFRNILLAQPKESADSYVYSLGEVTENAVYLSASATTADGGVGVRFSAFEAPLKPVHTAPGAFLVGRSGSVVTNSQGKLLAFIPGSADLVRTVTVGKVTAAGIFTSDGTKISVPSDTKLLKDGAETTFGEAFGGLNVPGLSLTIYYTASGAVDHIYVSSAVTGKTMVAAVGGSNAFDQITGGSRSCRVFKNGASSSLGQIRAYDVGLYDAASDTLYVSDFRLSCYFAASEPNPLAPVKVTLGKNEELQQTFDVSECAAEYMQDVKEGEFVTALFAPDGKVAALMPVSVVDTNLIGVTTYDSTQAKFKIHLIGAPDSVTDVIGILSPTLAADRLLGQVVSLDVKWEKHGDNYFEVLYPDVIASESGGRLNVNTRTLGSAPISDSALIYEKVGTGEMTQISLSEIVIETVPAEKVSFVHKNSSGEADILILDDVTGDRYTYGLVFSDFIATDYFGSDPIYNNVITVTNSYGETTFVGSYSFGGEFGGVAGSLNSSGEYALSAGYAKLTPVRDVEPSAFNLNRLTFTSFGNTIPIADDVQCYNSSSGRWFKTLGECLMYSTKYTVYYDRTTDTGAKVRVIVAK